MYWSYRLRVTVLYYNLIFLTDRILDCCENRLQLKDTLYLFYIRGPSDVFSPFPETLRHILGPDICNVSYAVC